MSKQHDSFLDALPNGWAFDRLKDVVALRNEKTDGASADEDYLELEDLESGTGRILNRRNTLEVESAVTLFKKGDVLFGKLRPYLEKYYEAEFDGKCTGEILAFKPERIASRFLFYCVGSRWFIERCNTLAYGAKMPRVSWPTQLSQFNVPLPPFPEQQRIAAYLDASCAAIDAAVAAKRGQLETLDENRKTTIHRVVTQGLNPDAKMKSAGVDWLSEVPARWCVDRIRDRLGEIVGGEWGDDPDAHDEGVKLPVIRVADIRGLDLTVEGLTIRRIKESKLSGRLIGKRTILLEKSGGGEQKPVGRAVRTRLIEFDAICSNFMAKVDCGDTVTPDFVVYLLDALYSSGVNTSCIQQTTGIQNLRVTDYLNTKVGIPPLLEQEQIVAYLDAKEEDFVSIVKMLESQIATLTAYRKSLIHECVTGQRRITEADLSQVKAHG